MDRPSWARKPLMWVALLGHGDPYKGYVICCVEGPYISYAMYCVGSPYMDYVMCCVRDPFMVYTRYARSKTSYGSCDLLCRRPYIVYMILYDGDPYVGYVI